MVYLVDVTCGRDQNVLLVNTCNTTTIVFIKNKNDWAAGFMCRHNTPLSNPKTPTLHLFPSIKMECLFSGKTSETLWKGITLNRKASLSSIHMGWFSTIEP